MTLARLTAAAEPRQNGPSILIEIINVSAPATRLVSAAQASARLGVSRQTLYSYVSRGLIRAVPVPDDTRRSLYDARDIAGLIEKRGRGRARRAIASSTTDWASQYCARR